VRIYRVFPLFLLAIACSAPASRLEGDPNRAIKFSDVEHLAFGRATQSEVEASFGRPDQVVDLKRDLSGMQAWIYREGQGDQRQDRLGILIDARTKVILSATWQFDEDDPLRQKDAALAHFGVGGFTAKKVGWIAKHEYSDDAVYSDAVKGVSFLVRSADQTLQSITLGSPEARGLAQNAGKH
jgi:hypothetical protein